MSAQAISAAAPKLFLLDVEGTVAPISLVTEELFPYARTHFRGFLEGSFNNKQVGEDLALLAEENQGENDSSCPAFGRGQDLRGEVKTVPGRDAALAYIAWLMDRDRKSTALKSLQGRIWKAGFESGELQGTLFADVPEAFVRWARGARIAIYSSGSAEAQKLLFRHSIFGDLTGFISGYFDTRTGTKAESSSYRAIADAMHLHPAEVLFLSDTVRELDAAREAGCATRLVVRAGNSPVAEAHGHAAVESLGSL
jgi:2,3-diketo-5-methylthio-1-phosphopentane phosphatase